MLTKAWVLQSINTLFRCVFAIAGSASWQEAYEGYKDNPFIN